MEETAEPVYNYDDDDGNQSDWWNPRATAWGPKPSALLSIICSYVVIREVLKDEKSKTASKVIGRVLLSMSISDIVFSFAWFLSTWPTPKGDEYWYLHQNSGNTATCTIQGFLYQFGFVASPLFNMSLAIFYLLIVKYNYNEKRLSHLEKWVQGSIWTFTLVASIYPIPLGLYNNNWEICWLDSYPPDCKDSWTYGDDEADCIRGDNAWIHGLFFLVFPSWFCLLVVSFTFLVLLRTIRQMENKSRMYAGTISKMNVLAVAPRRRSSSLRVINRNKSKLVAQRAMMYAVAFLFTYSLATVTSSRWYTTGKYNTVFDFCSFILLPLQGFFNFIVFASVRSVMKTPEGRLLRRIVFGCGESRFMKTICKFVSRCCGCGCGCGCCVVIETVPTGSADFGFSAELTDPDVGVSNRFFTRNFHNSSSFFTATTKSKTSRSTEKIEGVDEPDIMLESSSSSSDEESIELPSAAPDGSSTADDRQEKASNDEAWTSEQEETEPGY
jgi:hypothetical protein